MLPDFDLDIDSPIAPQHHSNAAIVVSIQGLLNSASPLQLMLNKPNTTTHIKTKETLNITIPKSLVGLIISLDRFHIIQEIHSHQNIAKTPPVANLQPDEILEFEED